MNGIKHILATIVVTAICSMAIADEAPLREIRVRDGHLQWVEFSTDGNHVAACGDRYIQMYSVETGERVQRFAGHEKDIVRFALSKDGKRLASASHDHTVRIWDTTSGETVRVIRGHSDGVIGVNFSPDGKFIVSTAAKNDGTIRVWSTADGTEVARASYPANSNAMYVAFSPDGRQLAASGYRGVVRLYSFDGSSLRLRWEKKHGGGEMVPHVSFSRRGKRLVTSGWDRTLRCWSVKDGSEVWRAMTPNYARCFETSHYSADGDTIVSVTRDETIQQRDAATGRLLSTQRWWDAGCRGLAVSRRGMLATVGHLGRIKLWRLPEAANPDDSDESRAALRTIAWAFGKPGGMLMHSAFSGSTTTRLLILRAAVQKPAIAKHLALSEKQKGQIVDLQPPETSEQRDPATANDQPDEQEVEPAYFAFLNEQQLAKLDRLALELDGFAALQRTSMRNRLQLSDESVARLQALSRSTRDNYVLPRLRHNFAATLPADSKFRDVAFAAAIHAHYNQRAVDVLQMDELTALRNFISARRPPLTVTQALHEVTPLPLGLSALRIQKKTDNNSR